MYSTLSLVSPCCLTIPWKDSLSFDCFVSNQYRQYRQGYEDIMKNKQPKESVTGVLFNRSATAHEAPSSSQCLPDCQQPLHACVLP